MTTRWISWRTGMHGKSGSRWRASRTRSTARTGRTFLPISCRLKRRRRSSASRKRRAPAGAGGAARRGRRFDQHRARPGGAHDLGRAGVSVRRRHAEHPSHRDSLRPLRAPDRPAARRSLRAARARREAARRRRADTGLQEEGKRMNKLLAQDKQPVAAALAEKPRAGAVKPVPEDALILIPMRNTVLFPGVISPVTVGRQGSVAAAQEAVRSERKVGFLLQRDPQKNDVGPNDLYWVGTAGQVVRYITGGEGAHHMVVQGQSRFRALEFLEGWPFLVARVQYIETPEEMNPEVEARFLQLKSQAVEAIQLLPNAPEELAVVVQGLTSPTMLADMVGNLLDVKLEDKQALLETFDLKKRLDRVLAMLSERVGVLRISKEIGDKTKKEFDERQREHVLREQMRQIQKELGEDEDTGAELAELKKQIEEAGMPEDVRKHATKELKRLQRMGEGSAEGSMLRTYLEWLAELPWKDQPQKPIDIAEARRVLDEDHYGLDKIKRRILEHLAVRKLNPTGKSPILCFVGPPGGGKTSLGQSIARATGRKFQRIALGGVHDEAEIRGHRRTYIGALPGNIIQALRRP